MKGKQIPSSLWAQLVTQLLAFRTVRLLCRVFPTSSILRNLPPPFPPTFPVSFAMLFWLPILLHWKWPLFCICTRSLSFKIGWTCVLLLCLVTGGLKSTPFSPFQAVWPAGCEEKVHFVCQKTLHLCGYCSPTTHLPCWKLSSIASVTMDCSVVTN